jgi:hypothetical protein
VESFIDQFNAAARNVLLWFVGMLVLSGLSYAFFKQWLRQPAKFWMAIAAVACALLALSLFSQGCAIALGGSG